MGEDYTLLALQEKGATFHYQVGWRRSGGPGEWLGEARL